MGIGTSLRITFLLPDLSLSGGVKAVRRIADGLVDKGHDVLLLSATPAEPWPPPWRPRRFLKRVAAEQRARAAPPNDVGFAQGTKARVRRVKTRLIAADDVPDADIVVATWWETAETAMSLSPSKGRKHYFVQADERELALPVNRTRVENTYRAPFRTICVSRFLVDVVKGFAGKDAEKAPTLVPVGVDDVFQAVANRRRRTPPTIGALYASHPSKGWDDALVALQLIRQRIPNVRITTFGSEPFHSRHAALPGVEHEMRPPQQRIAQIAASADVWLLPSVCEGFGLPGIEAAATGTPVVATRSGGPPDYVTDGDNGFLVDVGDTKAMAAALERVLTCDDAAWHNMSEAAARTAERFRWGNSVDAFERALLTP